MRSTNRAPLDTAAIRLAQAADEPRIGLISDALLLDAVAALREAGQPVSPTSFGNKSAGPVRRISGRSCGESTSCGNSGSRWRRSRDV